MRKRSDGNWRSAGEYRRELQRIVNWEVRYIQSDTTDRADENWESDYQLIRSAPYRHTIYDLLPATNYDVQVRAFNANGAGQWSEVASGTPYDPPGRPELAPLVLESQAVTIHWTRPVDDGGADINRLRPAALAGRCAQSRM